MIICGKALRVSWWILSSEDGKAKNPWCLWSLGLLALELPRDIIHQEIPLAFPHIVSIFKFMDYLFYVCFLFNFIFTKVPCSTFPCLGRIFLAQLRTQPNFNSFRVGGCCLLPLELSDILNWAAFWRWPLPAAGSWTVLLLSSGYPQRGWIYPYVWTHF